MSTISRFIGLIENKPTTERLILRVLFFMIIGGLLSIFIMWNNKIAIFKPVPGGTLSEGIIGLPRFVNPALAVTRADQDMSALIYSGLMKINSEGKLIPDLAQSVTVSNDGKTYNVILRNDVQFQDGTTLNAHDVSFTIGLIQSAELKSPLRANWNNVSVEEINDNELNIVLKEAYTPFIENFTIGILPKHIWADIPVEQIPFSQKNTDPIGSGPFMIKTITRDSAGLISKYSLKKFSDNTDVKLDSIDIHFYQNEDGLVQAFKNKEIMSTTQLPASFVVTLKNDANYKIIEEPLPRIFAVFFNQNRSPSLRDTAVRLALNAAINRKELVDTALLGFGVPIDGPVPPTLLGLKLGTALEDNSSSSSIETATNILIRGGWTKSSNGGWEKRIDGDIKKLNITLKTANTQSFTSTTEIIARSWRDLGVDVQVEQFEKSDLLQTVIRPRDFEGLLFGIDMNRSADLYPFWHSSQREDPALNISQYVNIEVDKLLESLRTSNTDSDKAKAAESITKIIAREAPAAFLYVPNLVYVIDSRVNDVSISGASKPQERFMNVGDWNMNTDKLWPIFK